MVRLGMNRVVVKDGTIAAKVRFRAAARDTASVNYAVSQEPGRPTWGERGNATYAPPATMISTVNANVQADTELKADLIGEVRINFVSETLPLDRFVDPARLALLQGNARVPSAVTGAPASAPLVRDAAPSGLLAPTLPETTPRPQSGVSTGAPPATTPPAGAPAGGATPRGTT
jgi:hypothetical protein